MLDNLWLQQDPMRQPHSLDLESTKSRKCVGLISTKREEKNHACVLCHRLAKKKIKQFQVLRASSLIISTALEVE
jgi:hypothetical protein